MSARPNSSPQVDVVEGTSGVLVAAGIVTMALFPLALPILALTAIALLPLALPFLAAVLVAALVAAPILLARRVARRATLRPLEPEQRRRARTAMMVDG
jgi:membrane protein implicated in regulation of membrane protease activity